MKKTLISLAAASLVASSAFAADKGIDFDIGGQAVVYYETHSGNGDNDEGYFDRDSSNANVGIQLDLGADLGNNFTFGAQVSYLDALGINKNVVGDTNVKQVGGSTPSTQAGGGTSTTDDLALTKIFIAKKIGNTTLKLGRQELPKSLSPLAYSEGWNVFKNTFEAIVAINTDIPKTTLVGAYVGGGTGMGLNAMSDLTVRNSSAVNPVAVDGEAYMITASTKAIPMTTLTASYYDLKDVARDQLGGQGNAIGADAIWVDAQIAPTDAPLDLKIGLQGGQIDAENSEAGVDFAKTTAYGAKVTAKVGGVGLKAIYTAVNGKEDAQVAIVNTGTGIKSPLYSQMMYNQRAIELDSKTIVVGASYNLGEMGTIAANYGMSKVGEHSIVNAGTKDQDYNELDLVYKVKAGGVQYFAIAAIRDWDNDITMNTTNGNNVTDMTKDTVVLFWARYNF
jgi:hypothetical protein